MKLFCKIPAILLAATLLTPALRAVCAGESLLLTAPEQMPYSIGTLRIDSDRDMNGAHVALYRVQDEGTFLYYAYDIALREELTAVCPVWEGDYVLSVSVPSDLSFEWLDYRYALSVPDPEMDEEQRYSGVSYTVRLDTDPEAPDDLDEESDPVIQKRVYSVERTCTFRRAPFVLGDMDGDGAADAGDAAQVLISAAAVGAGTDPGLHSLQKAQADLNGDGGFDSSDAADLLTYAAVTAAGDFSGDALSYMRSAENAMMSAENDG